MKNFPMFLRMADREVLILGGGEQAAQKARLMLKTEARITVLAEALDAELQAYVDERRIHHQTGDVTAQMMQDAKVVFSATGCLGAGAAHAALAETVGALINVVDQQEYCEAITPSLVDRDPVVVAIGTEGTAPVLGRLVKSKIETVLEPELGRFAAFAGRMRAAVAQHIAKPDRRAFWRWVFDGPPRQSFSEGHHARAMDMVKSAIASHGADILPKPTHVELPMGDDVDAVTLGALRLLQEAEIIHYAEGVHEPILELARRDAQRAPYAGTPPVITAEDVDDNTVVLVALNA